MTEAEKKAIYDKEYAKSLDWHKNEFSNYAHYLKIPLKERWEILEHFKSIFNIMKKCGVCRFEGEEPMSNVSDFMFKLKVKGDPSSLEDNLLISNHESCWTEVMFEQTEEEIEAAARSSAEMEVGMAEWREQKKLEEEELHKKDEKQWAKHWVNERAANEKAKREQEEWEAKMNAEKEELEAWYDGVRSELDKIRTGEVHWYVDDHLEESELTAIEKYANSLFAFTDAQNMGLTGFGLYSQNESRADAHEALLEVFNLSNNKYALHVTKSYDFSDDYDSRTQQYKHLSKDITINMLGYALLEAKKKEAEEKK